MIDLVWRIRGMELTWPSALSCASYPSSFSSGPPSSPGYRPAIHQHIPTHGVWHVCPGGTHEDTPVYKCTLGTWIHLLCSSQTDCPTWSSHCLASTSLSTQPSCPLSAILKRSSWWKYFSITTFRSSEPALLFPPFQQPWTLSEHAPTLSLPNSRK